MKLSTTIMTAAAAAALSLSATPALAQNTADPAATTTTYPTVDRMMMTVTRENGGCSGCSALRAFLA